MREVHGHRAARLELGNRAVNPSGFEFATATRIVFGRGRAKELPRHARRFGARALLVVGSKPARHQDTLAALRASGLEFATLSVNGEPTIEMVLDGTRLAKELDAEFVIGLGGGSVVDAGKAISALLRNPGEPLDYLEVLRPQGLDPAQVDELVEKAQRASSMQGNPIALEDAEVREIIEACL